MVSALWRWSTGAWARCGSERRLMQVRGKTLRRQEGPGSRGGRRASGRARGTAAGTDAWATLVSGGASLRAAAAACWAGAPCRMGGTLWAVVLGWCGRERRGRRPGPCGLLGPRRRKGSGPPGWCWTGPRARDWAGFLGWVFLFYFFCFSISNSNQTKPI